MSTIKNKKAVNSKTLKTISLPEGLCAVYGTTSKDIYIGIRTQDSTEFTDLRDRLRNEYSESYDSKSKTYTEGQWYDNFLITTNRPCEKVNTVKFIDEYLYRADDIAPTYVVILQNLTPKDYEKLNTGEILHFAPEEWTGTEELIDIRKFPRPSEVSGLLHVLYSTRKNAVYLSSKPMHDFKMTLGIGWDSFEIDVNNPRLKEGEVPQAKQYIAIIKHLTNADWEIIEGDEPLSFSGKAFLEKVKMPKIDPKSISVYEIISEMEEWDGFWEFWIVLDRYECGNFLDAAIDSK